MNNPSQTRPPRQLTRADILPLDDYVKIRRERRREISELKRRRRVEIGPFATFYFENFATMWQQVQEMLYIEKGGEAQIADELAAYNPLIPQGNELVATVMFEIDDPRRRATSLARLGGIENCAFIDIAGDKTRGEPDPTRENTDPDGKASAVQFIRFPFTPPRIAAFKKAGRPDRDRLRSPQLQPHGGDARTGAGRPRRGFRLDPRIVHVSFLI
jgi:hypothetical protein